MLLSGARGRAEVSLMLGLALLALAPAQVSRRRRPLPPSFGRRVLQLLPLLVQLAVDELLRQPVQSLVQLQRLAR